MNSGRKPAASIAKVAVCAKQWHSRADKNSTSVDDQMQRLACTAPSRLADNTPCLAAAQ
jgi:hypothetical protein